MPFEIPSGQVVNYLEKLTMNPKISWEEGVQDRGGQRATSIYYKPSSAYRRKMYRLDHSFLNVDQV